MVICFSFIKIHTKMKKLMVFLLLFFSIGSLYAQNEALGTVGRYIMERLDGNIVIRVSFDTFLNELKKKDLRGESYEMCKRTLEELSQTRIHSVFFPASTATNIHPASQWFLPHNELELYFEFDDVLPNLFLEKKVELFGEKCHGFNTDYKVIDERGIIRVFLPDNVCIYEMPYAIWD